MKMFGHLPLTDDEEGTFEEIDKLIDSVIDFTLFGSFLCKGFDSSNKINKEDGRVEIWCFDIKGDNK